MEPAPVKDTYGLNCNPDHLELLQTYQPLWLQNESKQSRNFQEYLNKASLHLGFRQDQDDIISLNDVRHQAVTAAVLREVLARGEKHAPELYAELTELVHNGVPNVLRPVAWPVFLHSEQHCSRAKYAKLVVLQQGTFDSLGG
eukprot:GHUV01022087.1.p1 GENE.GHUV01022087.1~~GHUV01022087.1.p1  ORF type:complete len:143 (+),score=12.63 GHUV01022087.1:134-562(+)